MAFAPLPHPAWIYDQGRMATDMIIHGIYSHCTCCLTHPSPARNTCLYFFFSYCRNLPSWWIALPNSHREAVFFGVSHNRPMGSLPRANPLNWCIQIGPSHVDLYLSAIPPRTLYRNFYLVLDSPNITTAKWVTFTWLTEHVGKTYITIFGFGWRMTKKKKKIPSYTIGFLWYLSTSGRVFLVTEGLSGFETSDVDKSYAESRLRSWLFARTFREEKKRILQKCIF